LEIGSDIASSIRNPAHFCGTFGHKPTFGLCPVGGQSVIEDARDCDILVIGPLARSADDMETMLSVIAGPGDTESAAYTLALPKPSRVALKDFRVALVLDDPHFEVDREVQAQLAALGDFLAREGVQVRTDARPAIDSREIFRLFISMIRATTSGRQTDAEFAAASERAKAMDFTQSDIITQTTRGNVMPMRDWIALDYRRHQLRQIWNKFFDDYDVLLCPAFPIAAHRHKPEPAPQRTLTVNGKELPYGNQLFWGGYGGVFYLPASVAPIGLTPAGLPCGVQIIGRQYADLTCIHFARLLERHYRSFTPPPGWM
jgi:amidase